MLNPADGKCFSDRFQSSTRGGLKASSILHFQVELKIFSGEVEDFMERECGWRLADWRE